MSERMTLKMVEKKVQILSREIGVPEGTYVIEHLTGMGYRITDAATGGASPFGARRMSLNELAMSIDFAIEVLWRKQQLGA